MTPRAVKGALAHGLGAAGRWGVRLIDAGLSRRLGVFAFCAEEESVLKVSPAPARTGVTLADGRRIPAGTPILALHLWNERLAVLWAERRGLALATALVRRVRFSLRMLEKHLQGIDPGGRIAALHGEIGFIPASKLRGATDLLERLGFEVRPRMTPGLRFWRGAFWQTLYSWWLMWTFGPVGLRTRTFRDMARVEVWMSREALAHLYGDRGG
ncbi:MAG: hypothetical protein M5U22_10200 [Thermoleophilia bacterium]|nr:hypothetical protein [Thermoleophilia bacterium]